MAVILNRRGRHGALFLQVTSELPDHQFRGYDFRGRFFWNYSVLPQHVEKPKQSTGVPISDAATLTHVGADVIICYVLRRLPAPFEPVAKMIDDPEMVTDRFVGVAIVEKTTRNELHL
jgi:hypothetical protein